MNPQENAEKTVWALHERPYTCRYNTGCMREIIIRYYRMRDNEMVMT